MLLTVDIGNTQTVIGMYEGAAAARTWRVNTAKSDTADELRVKLMPLLTSAGLGGESVTAAAIASVVPRLTTAWVEAVRELAGVEALVCNAETAAGLFEAHYPNPAEIGADRVADAVAAKALYGAPVAVVDFGTATNIEVIDATGAFVGGIIAPGMETGAGALFAHATRLSAIDLVAPPAVIGISSETAMQAGIVLGEADRVDGLMDRVFAQLGYRMPVVATGGLAEVVAPHSKTITAVNRQLTLEGLRLVAEAHGMK